MQVDRRHDGSGPCHTACLSAASAGGIESANHPTPWLACKASNPPDGAAVEKIFALNGDIDPMARSGFDLLVAIDIHFAHFYLCNALWSEDYCGLATRSNRIAVSAPMVAFSVGSYSGAHCGLSRANCVFPPVAFACPARALQTPRRMISAPAALR
jgi:hypothetical protein